MARVRGVDVVDAVVEGCEVVEDRPSVLVEDVAGGGGESSAFPAGRFDRDPRDEVPVVAAGQPGANRLEAEARAGRPGRTGELVVQAARDPFDLVVAARPGGHDQPDPGVGGRLAGERPGVPRVGAGEPCGVEQVGVEPCQDRVPGWRRIVQAAVCLPCSRS